MMRLFASFAFAPERGAAFALAMVPAKKEEIAISKNVFFIA